MHASAGRAAASATTSVNPIRAGRVGRTTRAYCTVSCEACSAPPRARHPWSRCCCSSPGCRCARWPSRTCSSASRRARRSVARHALPGRNLYSFTYPDHPDVDTAWLFEVGVAALYARGGFEAIVVAKTCCSWPCSPRRSGSAGGVAPGRWRRRWPWRRRPTPGMSGSSNARTCSRWPARSRCCSRSTRWPRPTRAGRRPCARLSRSRCQWRCGRTCTPGLSWRRRCWRSPPWGRRWIARGGAARRLTRRGAGRRRGDAGHADRRRHLHATCGCIERCPRCTRSTSSVRRPGCPIRRWSSTPPRRWRSSASRSRALARRGVPGGGCCFQLLPFAVLAAGLRPVRRRSGAGGGAGGRGRRDGAGGVRPGALAQAGHGSRRPRSPPPLCSEA